ncbi:MAG: hypothetical protein SFU56_02280 [Capsulimonadales bacterium]|nr:hypothetical protein [Capsulimonadales bacterium]
MVLNETPTIRRHGGFSMGYVVATYTVYLTLSVVLTVWTATTLFRNGRVFLIDVFHGNETIADSVNQLLVVGFYLINLGYVCLMMQVGGDVPYLRDCFEAVARKMGLVLLSLGGMHFLNLYLFSKIRRQRLLERELSLGR